MAVIESESAEVTNVKEHEVGDVPEPDTANTVDMAKETEFEDIPELAITETITVASLPANVAEMLIGEEEEGKPSLDFPDLPNLVLGIHEVGTFENLTSTLSPAATDSFILPHPQMPPSIRRPSSYQISHPCQWKTSFPWT